MKRGISDAGMGRINRVLKVAQGYVIPEIDEFTQQYMETALWSTNDESDPSGGVPLDENYSIDDINRETIDKMREDCSKFQLENEELLSQAYEVTGNDEARAGHDFWLTRNGHGAGFWDGDWGDFGDALSAAADKFGTVDLFIDDDEIYQT